MLFRSQQSTSAILPIDEAEPDYLLKIILIGDSGVGKTNLLSQFISHQFSDDTKTTIGVEFATKSLNINGKMVKAQIWDTAGQERYRSITSAYYKGANGAMILYDITSSISFNSVSKWLQELRESTDPNIAIMLVGNKNDQEELRSVKLEEGKNLAEGNRLMFLETSAKEAKNVEEAFHELINSIVECYTKNGITGKEIKRNNIQGTAVKKEEKSCC